MSYDVVGIPSYIIVKRNIEEGKRFEDVFKLILTKWQLSRTTFANYCKVTNEDFLKTIAERKVLFESEGDVVVY